jgi:hypothetical protein
MPPVKPLWGVGSPRVTKKKAMKSKKELRITLERTRRDLLLPTAVPVDNGLRW